MESSTFNLKQSIDDYINQIKNQGSITSSDATELTAHLYDAADSLTKLGLSEEEAFTIACKRLGSEEVLTEEYSKVNPSLKMNKVWAYLFAGFNMLYALPSLILTGVSLLYLSVYQNYGSSHLSGFIITGFHFILTILIWYIVGQKRRISQFIEKQVQENSLRFVCFSFIPFLIPLLFQIIPSLRIKNRPELNSALTFPVYKFDSDLSEFSFYLTLLSGIGALVSLVFSINKVENVSLKTVFNKPSIGFLMVTGIVLELFAASTRAINTDSILVSALMFALIYFFASFLITFYNSQNRVNRNLFIFSFFGVAVEILVGIRADIDRGNTIYTVYYVSFMLLAILLGRLMGIKSAKPALT